MKDELGGMFMTEFAALRPKTYSFILFIYLFYFTNILQG